MVYRFIYLLLFTRSCLITVSAQSVPDTTQFSGQTSTIPVSSNAIVNATTTTIATAEGNITITPKLNDSMHDSNITTQTPRARFTRTR